MKTWKHWTLVAIIAFFGIIVSFTACDNGNGKTNPVLCECPNGTEHFVDEEPCCEGEDCSCTFTKKRNCICTVNLHLVGETCCDHSIYNCNCETNVAGQRVNGIPVTNRDTVDNFDKTVTAVTAAVNSGVFSATQKDFIKNNIKEIKIITGPTSTAPYFDPNNVLIMVDGSVTAGIINTLDDWLVENGIE